MPLRGGECVFRKEALMDGKTKILTATYLLNLTFKTQRPTVFSAYPSYLKTFAIEFIFELYFFGFAATRSVFFVAPLRGGE
jgi:hypothetical protein